MDILDLDDEFGSISLITEDQQDEDISDILKQWKANSSNNNLDLNAPQGFNLNTRTFTRPKRKIVPQTLDFQFKENPEIQGINPQIGGLVTNMQQSFLQDTSPPASICSSFSMDYSLDRLNNSLITSADFSNVSTIFQNNIRNEDLENTFLEANYSISDLIRDRKTLDQLTMSGESTLIKDSNIAQIDEVSLMSSSTVHNSSTDSLSYSGDQEFVKELNATFDSKGDSKGNTTFGSKGDATFEFKGNVDNNATFDKTKNINATFDAIKHNATFDKNNCNNATFDQVSPPNLTFDAIANTTCNLVDNTAVTSSEQKINESFTAVISSERKINESFTLDDVSFEDIPNQTPRRDFRLEQSTPHHTKFNLGPKNTPLFRGIINEENLSPITSLEGQGSTQFDKTILKASYEGGNEEDFYNMLDRFGKFQPSAEEMKIQKSVDSIKKKYAMSNGSGEVMTTGDSGNASNSSSGSMVSSGSACQKLTSSATSLSTSTDRLLNRRGRLYDDIPMNMSQKSLSIKETITTSLGEHEKDENTAADSQENGLDQIGVPQPDESSDPEKTETTNNRKSKIRDRERFKTIKITRRSDETNEQLNVPCIDNTEPVELDPANERFSRIDSQVNSPSNYLTYKKPKESKKIEEPLASNPRSLSRPRYIGGLKPYGFKNENFAKAASADDLEKSSEASSMNDLTIDMSVQPKTRFGFKTKVEEAKSPMGNKAKSLHNLTNNFGFSAKKPVARTGLTSGLRAPTTSVGGGPAKPRPVSAYVQKPTESVFKVPLSNPPVALRKPTTAAPVKKNMARPSSGYYGSSAKSSDSLNEVPIVQKPMGIPKPSGLRLPQTVAKKSGLPRPSSTVRR